MTSRLVVGAAAALLVLAGCSTGDDRAGTSPSVVPEETTQAAEPTPTTVALDDRALLDAGEMPEWSGVVWVATDEAEVLRACTLPSPDSLGASAVVTRTFVASTEVEEGTTPDPDAEPMLGINQVATWEDDDAAAAAVEVWTTALDECSDGVGQLSSVDGGSTWVVSARDESSMNESWFDFVATAAADSTTTLVAFSLWGQDANVEDDPLADAMQASLDRIP